jgi:hypothetical protein
MTMRSMGMNKAVPKGIFSQEYIRCKEDKGIIRVCILVQKGIFWQACVVASCVFCKV